MVKLVFHKKLFIACIYALLLFTDGIGQELPKVKGDYHARFRQYNYERYNICVADFSFPLRTGMDTIVTWQQAKWQVMFKDTHLKGESKVRDLQLQVTCLSGNMYPASISLELQHNNWSKEKFVLMPAAVYNGNRFISRKIPYSPRILLPQDAGLQAPIVISDVPRLKIEDGFSRIQERSGGMSLPCVGVFDSLHQHGQFLITSRQNELGDYGFEIEESRDRSNASIRITSPVVRELYSYKIGNTQIPSIDSGHVFKKGEAVTLKAQFHDFAAVGLGDFYKYYFDQHQELLKAASSVQLQLPLSAAFKLIEDKYNRLNWNDEHKFYAIDAHTGNKKWKPGWVGGQITAFAFVHGSEQSRKRIMLENNWLFPAGISPSGFFFERCENGTNWIAGDPSKFHTKDWHLIRSSADGLLYTFKQLEWYKQHEPSWRNYQGADRWEAAAKNMADAFVRNWKLYGQWGQFVNSQDGTIAVGGSASASVAPAALVKAAAWFNDTVYMAVAKEAARMYYHQFIQKGITTGGPGDALQNPDSESCFGLIESFMALYQATGQREWITYAEETVHQFSTWVMPYNFQFPASSLMGSIKVSTTGTVWANAQNKHAAPGICIASGLPLLQLFQATGKEEYLLLLQSITQSALQYVSHPSRPIAKLPFGFVDERVSTTDWMEGIGEIGRISTWAEVAILLMDAELPGIYIDADKNRLWTLDHVKATIKVVRKQKVLQVNNPTSYEAVVKVAVATNNFMSLPGYQTIVLKPGENKSWHITKDGMLRAYDK